MSGKVTESSVAHLSSAPLVSDTVPTSLPLTESVVRAELDLLTPIATTYRPLRPAVDYPWVEPYANVFAHGDERWVLTSPSTGTLSSDFTVKSGNQSISLGELLAALDLAPMSTRVPLLGVGSNRSVSVAQEKLAAASVSTSFPTVEVQVHGYSIGYIPRLASTGYIPAAPVVTPGAVTTMSLAFLDEAQADAVDATEVPNYLRAELDPSAVPALQLPRPPMIYMSATGLLNDASGQPLLGIRDQRELFASVGAVRPSTPFSRPYEEAVDTLLSMTRTDRTAAFYA